MALFHLEQPQSQSLKKSEMQSNDSADSVSRGIRSFKPTSHARRTKRWRQTSYSTSLMRMSQRRVLELSHRTSCSLRYPESRETQSSGSAALAKPEPRFGKGRNEIRKRIGNRSVIMSTRSRNTKETDTHPLVTPRPPQVAVRSFYILSVAKPRKQTQR